MSEIAALHAALFGEDPWAVLECAVLALAARGESPEDIAWKVEEYLRELNA